MYIGFPVNKIKEDIMRILILVILCFLIIGSVNAKSWLIVNKQNQEILSLSPENDAQLPDDTYEKIIIDENFWDIQLTEHPTMYKYKNGKFIKNIEKISNIEIEKEEAEKEMAEEKLISERMRKIARDQLVAEGILKE